MYIKVTSTLTCNVHVSSSAEFRYFVRARVDRSICSDGYTSILLHTKYTKMNVADNSFSQAKKPKQTCSRSVLHMFVMYNQINKCHQKIMENVNISSD